MRISLRVAQSSGKGRKENKRKGSARTGGKMKELYDIAKRLNNEEAIKVLKLEGESDEK